MIRFKTKLAKYCALGLLLAACDPATIDPDYPGAAASGGSGSGSALGLFQLLSDDFSGGDLTNADIRVSSGEKSGSGTASSPLLFTLAHVYTFTWASSISVDSRLEFSLYSPENPDVETPLAEISCSASSGSSCSTTQEMDCWFVAAQGGSDGYYTKFFCKHEEDFVNSINSMEDLGETFLSSWSGLWADLDTDLGVKVRLCDEASESSCDAATLGYLNLKGYVE